MRNAHRPQLWRTLVLLGCAMAATSLAFSVVGLLKVSDDAQDRAAQIRRGQLENCVKVGDPLLEAQKQSLRDQIGSAKSLTRGDLHKLFPGFNPKKLDRLVAGQQAKRRRVLHKLERVPPCRKRFGPPVLP